MILVFYAFTSTDSSLYRCKSQITPSFLLSLLFMTAMTLFSYNIHYITARAFRPFGPGRRRFAGGRCAPLWPLCTGPISGGEGLFGFRLAQGYQMLGYQVLMYVVT